MSFIIFYFIFVMTCIIKNLRPIVVSFEGYIFDYLKINLLKIDMSRLRLFLLDKKTILKKKSGLALGENN